MLDGHLKDTYEVLELYRASQTIIYPYESDLEKQKSWSKRFLEQKLYTGSVHLDKYAQMIFKEVFLAIYRAYSNPFSNFPSNLLWFTGSKNWV